MSEDDKWMCMIHESDYKSKTKTTAILGAILEKENQTELLGVLEDN